MKQFSTLIDKGYDQMKEQQRQGQQKVITQTASPTSHTLKSPMIQTIKSFIKLCISSMLLSRFPKWGWNGQCSLALSLFLLLLLLL